VEYLLQLQHRITLRVNPVILRCSIIAAPQQNCLFKDSAMSAFPHTLQLVKPREIFIRGITADGRIFRPSDWAERLAGLMARFRPVGLCRKEAHLGYSPYCVPTVVEGVRCLVVSESLRDIEPMAFDFLLNFARDNQLDVVEACLTQVDAAEPDMADLDLARDALQRVLQTA
jgi:hypothetical protein